MITVMIVDDQQLLRNSLKRIIDLDDALEVIALAGDGKEGVEKCMQYKPDIVIMDIEMPVMDGITALKKIKESVPDTKVIMLTTFDSRDNILNSFLANADGYITKETTPEQLLTTLKCVSYGFTVIHNVVKDMMIDRFEMVSVDEDDIKDVLNEEELEIVKMIVYGHSNKDIADYFKYSEGTIKNKVSKIYEKVGVADRIQLAVYALKNGSL